MLEKIKTHLSKAWEFITLYKKSVISFMSVFVFWLFFFHYTDVNEVAICRNIITGETYLDSIAGPNITAPWVQVAQIDTRPRRICVECDCKNISCMLVTFKKEEWKEFVRVEGFRYYWWANRFSFNMSHKKTYRGVDDILKGYAFDGSKHKFIEIKEAI